MPGYLRAGRLNFNHVIRKQIEIRQKNSAHINNLNNKDLKLTLQQKKKINPLLTIATINLNNADGLARTLKSFRPLRNNTEIELIFQDGGSTDQSVHVAETFYRPDEIISKKDKGIYDAMNKTLKRAKGDYIIWINSGDEIKSDSIESVMKDLITNHADVYVCAIQWYDSKTRISGTQEFSLHNLIESGVLHQSTIFKKKAINDVNGYDERFIIAGDLDLLLRLSIRKYIFASSDRILSRFYLGGISSTSLYWPELWKAYHKNKIISKFVYLANLTKYYLHRNIPFCNRLRLRQTVVFGKERQIPMNTEGL